MPRSFALGNHFEGFIENQVKKGRYNNASEVVRDALRLMEDKQQEPTITMSELRQLIQEGIDSGEGAPANEVFAGLRDRYSRMAEETRSE